MIITEDSPMYWYKGSLCYYYIYIVHKHRFAHNTNTGFNKIHVQGLLEY